MIGLDEIRGTRARWVIGSPADGRAPDLGGAQLPVYRVLGPGQNGFEEITAILSLPYVQSFLKVGHAYGNFLSGRGQRAYPPCFFTGADDPRAGRGFQLLDRDGTTEVMPDVPYTLLTTHGNPFPALETESILLHEYGHTMMNALLGAGYMHALGQPYTRMHLATTTTDYLTAYLEGWGIHFEPLTVDMSPTPGIEGFARFDASPVSHFVCRAERMARLVQVPANGFIYQPVAARHLAGCPKPAAERLAYEATHGVFDAGRLRSPQSMLSCEGVVASLFYRWLGDEATRNTYAAPEFYREFFPNGYRVERPKRPEALFTPLENAYLKVGAAMYEAARVQADLPPVVSLISSYGAMFPAEKEQVYRLFLENTAYVTASPSSREIFAKLHSCGRLAQIPSLQSLMKEWQAMARQTLQSALAGGPLRETLIPLVGPELWVVHPEVKVAAAYWLPAPGSPLSFNLNTCMGEELMTVPGMTWDMAERILAARDRLGLFESVCHLASAAALPTRVAAELERMRDAFAGEPPSYHFPGMAD
ncbi:MAG: helix-hairpin-helix domain-containing protein [Bacillota bacterium]|nr:helix-hairpin-helix domain-containing protein [Bacillota bacterium]